MEDTLGGNAFAGLSGTQLSFDEFELGHGITLRSTYAHLMAPFLMAFAPAPPGKHHPGPWKAAAGGVDHDVVAELHVPASFVPIHWGDRLRVIRWIVALIRMWAMPSVAVPVISNQSFSAAATAPDHTVQLIPFEVTRRGIAVQAPEDQRLTPESLEWVREHWESGAVLVNEHKEFDLAVQALDQSHFIRDPALAMISVWGALENIFSRGKSELRFRVSSFLSAYLEDPGPERRALQRRLARLYDARSKAAHGQGDRRPELLVESMEMLRQALIKMINESRVPTNDDLEERLLG